jgi:hypothetical protein
LSASPAEKRSQLVLLREETTDEALMDAWREHLGGHRDKIAANVERAAELLRSGDMEGLVAHANRDAARRSRRAAKSAQE